MRTVYCFCTHFLLWSLLPLVGYAQTMAGNDATFRVDRISVSDGLTQGSVYYMLKDSRGFLWCGTQDGLNRYDGHRFRTYRPVVDEHGAIQPGTIRGGNILGIVEDPDGNLWIGTDEGLNRYDRQRDRFDYFFASRSTAGHPYLANRTMPFFVNQHELLYLSDSEGLVQFDYRKLRKTILATDLHATKKYDLQGAPVLTPSGDVWLQEPKGLMRYNLHTNTRSYYFSDHANNQFGPPKAVLSYYIDSDDIVWMGTNTGLIRFDYRRNAYQAYTTVDLNTISAIYSIAPDQLGRLWLGTDQDGVLYFDKKTQSFGQITMYTNYTQRLTDFKINKVYVDDLGIIWANADPDGLARIVPNAFVFGGIVKRQFTDTLASDQKLTNYVVRGFLEEQPDRIWILTENGINVLNPRTNRIVERFLTRSLTKAKASRPFLKSLYRDPQGRIWVGTTEGVMAFQAKTRTFEPIPFSMSGRLAVNTYTRKLISIADTILIAATEDGLYSLNTLRRRWSRVTALAGQNIFSLWYNANARQLWVGTHLNGYYCYQLPASGSQMHPWKLIKSGLNGYMVLNIRPDNNRQVMWLASSRGLVALNVQTGKFRLYTELQGLANAFIYETFSDTQNRIWMSTNRGISRLNPATQMIKNFTPNDGLQGYEFNGNAFLKAGTGELYFGGVNGFNRFIPDAFRSSLFDPHVQIYSLNVNEEPLNNSTYVGETDHIDLNHAQNTLALEFAALDYSSNGHNTYQYQLTNYDNHWIAAGERNYVRYTNLPPGNYTFQVRAANQDGRWSPYIRKLVIHIEPPFWLTLPFVILVILVILGIIWAWIRQRENGIRLQQEERLRLAYDIQEQVKKDIARDIHDEIGTRLATIKLYTTQLTQQVGETPTILSLKNTIFQLINDTIGDVRNLLRKLNPQTLERHGYVAAVEELFSRISASEVVSAQFLLSEMPASEASLSEGESRLPTDIEVMLYRITQELVSNSLKHANATRIDLHMMWQADRIVLIYEDNGQGFNYEQTQKKATGLGMSNIESRVAILSGRISWQSQPGQGVQATIDVPISVVRKRRFFETKLRYPYAN